VGTDLAPRKSVKNMLCLLSDGSHNSYNYTNVLGADSHIRHVKMTFQRFTLVEFFVAAQMPRWQKTR
jgi:hypothetical protein